MSFTGGRLKLKGDDTGVKKKKKRKSKAEDESKALQLAEEATEQNAMPKVCSHDTLYAGPATSVYLACTKLCRVILLACHSLPNILPYSHAMQSVYDGACSCGFRF